MALSVGLDVGKEFHWVEVIDSEENRLFSRRVENTQDDIDKLFSEVKMLGSECKWGCDMSDGPAALFLALALARGEKVVYVTGITVNRERDSFPGESKSDSKDAFIIAQVVRMRRNLRPFAVSPDLSVSLRFLLSRHNDLTVDQTRILNRLRALLVEVFPGLERTLNPGSQGALVFLSNYQTPSAIRRAGKDRITQILKKHAVRKADKIAEAAVIAATGQSVSLPGEKVASTIIGDLAKELLSLKKRITLSEKELAKHFFLHPQARIISSLSGFGVVLGAQFIVAAGDLSRFENPDRLAAYAGIAPAAHDSGKKTGNNKRAKSGNRTLKNVFYQSAFCSLKDPISRAYYDRKKKEGKCHRQALISLARRRVNVLFAMLRDNSEYTQKPNISSKIEVLVA